MFTWFDSKEAEAFGRELAASMAADLQGENLESLKGKSLKRAERTMERAARKVDAFRSGHKLNVYKKSRLANAFLWTLKESGLPPDVANQMTDWLTPRL